MENRKIVVSAYLVASMVVWFLTRSGLFYLHQSFYEVRKIPGILAIREAFPVVAALALFVFLMKYPKATPFFDDVVSELKKVTWPTREDVTRSTTVVLVCIGLAAGFIAVVDLGWGKLFSLLLSL
jgi:preprotein translocase subunit SecE